MDGQFFRLETGDRWTAIQCSDFNLLNRWQHGEDITPVLAQRRDCGFNLLRVWTLYDIPRIGVFRDIDYTRVGAFLGLCAGYGLYVEFTAYTSIEIRDHWSRLVDAVQGQTAVMLELVNEFDHGGNINTIDLSAYARPAGVICSHGSNTVDQWPVEPPWDYVTIHWNGDQWQRKVGHNTMESADRYHVPALANENCRCPDQDAHPNHYYDAALGAALLCAGSCFHSVHGKDSTLWEGEELTCAIAHAAGAANRGLEWQTEGYRHGADEVAREQQFGFLRCYRRGDSPFVDIRP